MMNRDDAGRVIDALENRVFFEGSRAGVDFIRTTGRHPYDKEYVIISKEDFERLMKAEEVKWKMGRNRS